MIIDIYKHTSPSGKSYIGQSCKGINERLKQHAITANNGCEYRFHQAIRKYGIAEFKSEKIDQANSSKEADEKEIFWISYYDTYNNGYNMTKGGYGREPGWTHTEETKQKLSEYAKNRPDEHNKNLSNSLKGNIPWNKGIKLTEEQKNYGWKQTEETKQKLSEMKTGMKYSDEVNKKKGRSGEENAMFGKNHTEETKQKMKEKSLGRIWIFNEDLKETKRVYDYEFKTYEELNWKKGRKIKWN